MGRVGRRIWKGWHRPQHLVEYASLWLLAGFVARVADGVGKGVVYGVWSSLVFTALFTVSRRQRRPALEGGSLGWEPGSGLQYATFGSIGVVYLGTVGYFAWASHSGQDAPTLLSVVPLLGTILFFSALFFFRSGKKR